MVLALANLPDADAASSPPSRIVSSGRGLFTSDTTGGDVRQVHPDGTLAYSAGGPQWSNDGTRIAYAYNWELWVMRADGTGAHRVVSAFRVLGFSWSADDSRLFYTTDQGGGGPAVIGWSTPDSREQGALPPGDGGSDVGIVASRDGRTLAVATAPSGSRPEIVTMDVSGANRRVIARSAGTDLVPVDWSPDGRKLLAVANIGNRRLDVLVMNADGSGRTTIREDAVPDAWSPDGSRILFHDPATAALRSCGPTGAGR